MIHVYYLLKFLFTLKKKCGKSIRIKLYEQNYAVYEQYRNCHYFLSPTIVNIWRINLIFDKYVWMKLHSIIHGCLDLITNLSIVESKHLRPRNCKLNMANRQVSPQVKNSVGWDNFKCKCGGVNITQFWCIILYQNNQQRCIFQTIYEQKCTNLYIFMQLVFFP
jgi:hypothetical protein